MQTETLYLTIYKIVKKAQKKKQKESKYFKQRSLNCTPSSVEQIKRGREKKNTAEKSWNSLDEFGLLKWI